MNNKQEAKLRMYNVVIMVLNRYDANVKSISMLATEAANFDGIVKQIEALHPKQAVDSKGVTEGKNILRWDLGDMATVLAGALFSLASHKNDADLCERMNFSNGSMRRLSLADFNRICSEVLSECGKHIDELAPYGVKAEQVAAYTSKMTEFKTASSLPRESKVEKASATSTLEELYATADSILFNHLDGLVPQLKTLNIQFFKDYQNARIIEDRGSRKTVEPVAPTSSAT